MAPTLESEQSRQSAFCAEMESLSAPAPSHEEIARLAYSLWESRGDAPGSAEEDWFRAERELRP